MKTKWIKGIFLVLITGIVFASCSKDSDPAEDILGSWTIGTVEFDASVGTKSLKQYYMDEFDMTEPEALAAIAAFNAFMAQQFTGTIEFNSDSTYEAEIGGESDTGTWSLSADNEKLTIDPDLGDPYTFDLIEISSKKAVLQGTETFEEDLNEDEVPETVSVIIKMNLTK
jgi:hypothetical protein